MVHSKELLHIISCKSSCGSLCLVWDWWTWSERGLEKNFVKGRRELNTVKLVIRGHSIVHHQCPRLTRCPHMRDFNYSHSTYQLFHFFKYFLTFIYIVTYSPSNVWFTFFSLIFALLVSKLRPFQTDFIKSTMVSPEETARCPHMRR